ncbi:DUF1488 domain-containing protein [Ancylobacter mangrovi]|uniref:DUF1488 domain-containing protein n=1 Tax=Ancylobacter mangrovi TaxID=2972472 RepID=UPI0021629AC6|nr:DUF1488 domain-containing protein [Ancylobacter mangrovi]MCS0501602.1 DUF1488 domain-containing protein [Ancylobacter mangrovi]
MWIMALMRVSGEPTFDDETTIRFPMRDATTGQDVTCSISAEALRKKFGAGGDPLRAFMAHRVPIELAVSVRYRRDGTGVHLSATDL